MSEVGDITEIIRPVDLQDVGALSLTVSPGFHQPHNPSHAPTPDQRSDAKLPLRRPHPQSPGSPLAKAHGKLEIEPHVADHFRRKTMAAIQRATGSRYGRRFT